jgi:hypothetical protein
MHLDQRIAAIQRVEGALSPLQEEGYSVKRILYDDEVKELFLIAIHITYDPPADVSKHIL